VGIKDEPCPAWHGVTLPQQLNSGGRDPSARMARAEPAAAGADHGEDEGDVQRLTGRTAARPRGTGPLRCVAVAEATERGKPSTRVNRLKCACATSLTRKRSEAQILWRPPARP
jgi:hypothetical protein